MTKYNRNDPCWCGSGKKYKHCHYRREYQELVKKSEAIKNFNAVRDMRECLQPQAITTNCMGNIIKAHTVQNNGQLSRIARNNHVYGYDLALGSLFSTGGRARFELIGINNASTFTGFCEKHDTEIFRKIETEPIILSTEQIFLFGYRAICMEYFKKKVNLGMPPLLKEADKGKSFIDQIGIQNFAKLFEIGNQMGFNDIKITKNKFDAVLLSGNFSELSYAIIEIDTVPEVMASGCFDIEIDFAGRQLQNLSQPEPLTPLTFSLLATDSGGAAIFSWITSDNEVFKYFIDSLVGLGEDMIPHALLRMTFEMLENLYVSPDWWESLADDDKNMMIARLGMSPTRKKIDYSDDGVRVVDWRVKNITTNYYDCL